MQRRKLLKILAMALFIPLVGAFNGATVSASLASEKICDMALTKVLTGCDFRGADLRNVSFEGYLVTNVDFRGADLTGASFAGVNVSNSNFGPDLNSSAPEASLDVIVYEGEIKTYVAPYGAFTRTELRYQSRWTPSCGADVTLATGVDVITLPWNQFADACPGHPKNIIGKLFYSGGPRKTVLKNANLSGANLSNSVLSGVDLSGSNIADADFYGASLDGVYSRGVSGSPLALPRDWRLIGSYLMGPGANLFGADLYSYNLTNMNLSGANLSQAFLAYANLSQANLSGANLFMANLERTNLENTNFSDANLSKANLTWARVVQTNFSRSSLVGITRNCLDYWQCYYSNLAEYSLTRANLTGVKSQGFFPNGPVDRSDFVFLPSNWVLRSGYLFGPTANLSGANLRQLDLSGLDLSQANLSGADFAGSSFGSSSLVNADLNYVKSGAVTGSPVLPEAWKLVGGFLVGPKANLSNGNLSNQNLYGLDLTSVNLTNANLTNANLWGANLTNADLTNADLTRARLDGVSANGVIGSPILPAGWTLTAGSLSGPDTQLNMPKSLVGADLSGLNLSGINLSNTDLSFANFEGSNLSGVVFENSKLNNANLSRTNLDNAVLTRASLVGTKFTGADLSSADLNYTSSGSLQNPPTSLPSGWKIVKGYLFGPTANLAGANLSGTNLDGLDLSRVNFVGANLANAKLTNANLTNGMLRSVNLSGANLAAAVLKNANLSGANLSNSVLSGVDLSGSNIADADFYGASLDGVYSRGVSGSPLALPRDWRLIGSYLMGPGANLFGADLYSYNLTNMNLSGANLSQAFLAYANLSQANLSGANLFMANLERTNLENTNFSDANLSKANLTWARVVQTNFSRSSLVGITRNCLDYWQCYYSNLAEYSLTRANLTGVKSQGFFPNGPVDRSDFVFLPSNWVLRSGYLFGPTANLSGANLRQLDLSGLDLSQANLSGADFAGSSFGSSSLVNADLNYVKSGAVTGSPVLPEAWKLVGGFLVGPKANLSNGNLSNQNLYGLDLTSVNLTNANLTNANLWGANLTNADLTNADLTNADLSSANLTSAVLALTSLESVISDQLVGEPSVMPLGWAVVGGQLLPSVTISDLTLLGVPQLGEKIQAVFSSYPTTINVEYQWLRNGVPIPSATLSNYEIAVADVGKNLSLRISASSPGLAPRNFVSNALTISNQLQALSEFGISGSGEVGETIQLSAQAPMRSATVSFEVSTNAENTWRKVQGSQYKVLVSDAGKTVRFRAVQSASGHQSTYTEIGELSISDEIALSSLGAGVIESSQAPQIFGDGLIGSTVRAIRGAWPAGTRVTAFWYSSKLGILNDRVSYRVMLADLGSTLNFVERAQLANSQVVYKVSNPIQVAANSFTNSAPPVVTGSMRVGSKLSAKVHQSWATGAKYTWQWFKNSVAIESATRSTYAILPTDLGSEISVRVCATKVGYEQKCEYNSNLDSVALGLLALSSTPRVTGTLKQGSILRGWIGRWQAGSTLQLSWYRNGVEIIGANSDSYRLTAEDLGKSINFGVRGSAPGYITELKTSALLLVPAP